MLQEEKLEQAHDANATMTTMASSHNPNNALDNTNTTAPPDLCLLEKPSPSSTYPAKINNFMKPLGKEIKEAALNNPN